MLHHVLRPHPEPKPVVRRHHQQSLRAGTLRLLRVARGFVDAFAADAANDRDRSADLVRDDACDLGTLFGGKRKHLAGVAVGD